MKTSGASSTVPWRNRVCALLALGASPCLVLAADPTLPPPATPAQVSPFTHSALGKPPVAAPTPDWRAANTAFGTELWSNENLWDDLADEVAARLRWPAESKTSTSSSFRLYPAAGYQILGAHPFSAALYGSGGKVSHLSLVFANKGDDPDDYRKAIPRDDQTIFNALVAAFGAPVRERFGEGSSTQERVRRWDWQGHSFLLASPASEYVVLRIIPTAVADAEGRTDRVKAADLKIAFHARVQQRDNGDVLITDIPMVDQGPKGYCAPASWERYLRYLGIDADMYVLAMAGHTTTAGGTTSAAAAGAATDLVRKHGMQVVRVSVPPTAKGVAKYIDAGLPLLWSMYYVDEIEDAAEARSKERKNVTDWAQWTRRLVEVKRSLGKTDMKTRDGHICLIVGYNPKTKEVAVSNSYGFEAKDIWMTEDEAQKSEQGGFYSVAL